MESSWSVWKRLEASWSYLGAAAAADAAFDASEAASKLLRIALGSIDLQLLELLGSILEPLKTS